MRTGRGARAAGRSVARVLGGIDEAGRGPLAGPVVAAIVVLEPGQRIRGVCDSKALLPEQRERLADRIRARALDFAVGVASVTEIDHLNILQATFLAMRRAFAGLRHRPEAVRVDGNQLPWLPGFVGQLEAVVDGDQLCHEISAASILAKVCRDEMMLRLHELYPQYGFDRHKGYSTRSHLQALRAHGPCEIHRRSFAPVRAVEWCLA